MTNDIWNTSGMYETCEITGGYRRIIGVYVSLFEKFASNQPFICNHHQTICNQPFICNHPPNNLTVR